MSILILKLLGEYSNEFNWGIRIDAKKANLLARRKIEVKNRVEQQRISLDDMTDITEVHRLRCIEGERRFQNVLEGANAYIYELSKLGYTIDDINEAYLIFMTNELRLWLKFCSEPNRKKLTDEFSKQRSIVERRKYLKAGYGGDLTKVTLSGFKALCDKTLKEMENARK